MPLPALVHQALQKPVQAGTLRVSRLQALFLAKRLEAPTDAAAVNLVNAALGCLPDDPALTLAEVRLWEREHTYNQAYAQLGRTDRAALWRALATIYFADDAWSALARLLRSNRDSAVRDGLKLYLQLAGLLDLVPATLPDPTELARGLVEAQQVQIVQVYRSNTTTIEGQARDMP